MYGNMLAQLRGGRLQKEIADEFGVSQQGWSLWERGERVPPPEVMLKLEKKFGMPMENIFFGVFNNAMQ